MANRSRRLALVALVASSCGSSASEGAGTASVDRSPSTPITAATPDKTTAAVEPAESAEEGVDDSDSVVITIPLSNDMGTSDERALVIRLEDDLEATIVAAGLGYLDGDGFGLGSADIFFYGSDADAMFEAMRPLLRAADLPDGTIISLFDERTPDGRDAPLP